MNRDYILLFIFFMIATMSGKGQEKRLSLDDLILGGTSYNSFVPRLKYNALWMGDQYILSNRDTLFIVDPSNPQKKETLITRNDLRSLLSAQNANIRDVRFHCPDDQVLASIIVRDSAGRKQQSFFDIRDKQIKFTIPMEENWGNLDVCPQSRLIAFTIENNLYVSDAKGNKKNVTWEENKNIVSGTEVHRSEFGIYKGTFWSPQGNLLAFYKKDENMVEDYPLVDISAREAKLKNIKYPMAGMKSHQVKVGIYHPVSGNVVYLRTGFPYDRYFTNISWSPDEKNIYIAELNRKQDTCRIVRYNTQSGKKEAVLFEETHDKYVEPEHPLLFLKKTPHQFIWQSERDGYNHLYLYDVEGRLIKQLTSGNFDVLDILGVDPEEKFVYITSTEKSPIESHLYKIDIKTGEKIQLSTDSGVHNPSLNISCTYILDEYSNQSTPKNLDLINTVTKVKTRLAEAKDPYKDYLYPEITIGTIQASDGRTDLYYRLVKPVHFNPSEKYPVIVYVYGGPHNQSVRNSWKGAVRGWDVFMAQKGYVVFTLDNRGTSNRGLEFENVIHGNLGVYESEDQMNGIEFLKSLPYVDAGRIGVHGWSYGGFMTINLMLRHPDVFRVGVAGGPVIDWKYYEVMYGERYMGNPKDNKSGYQDTNLNNLAGNLLGRLLVIHGDEDPTVVWQNSLSFLKACVKAKTHPDYFVYPGHGHNVLGPDRIHLHEKITRYFDDFLK